MTCILSIDSLNLFAGKYTCPNYNCDREYVHRPSLLKHLKFECGVSPKFHCQICNKYFKQPISYKMHMGNKHSKISFNL